MKPAPQQSRHLGPGDRLGKYDLIRQIAIGGMAELYLARTVGIEGFEKLSVIKRILPQFATNATFVNMFLNEARLAATLHHPNVAQVYDIGVEDGDYFFAMEYVHGEDLDRISSQSNEQGVPISLDAALTLVAGLCAGLHYAHEKIGPDGTPLQIVHRDVSPSNVLVSYDGAIKLVDFGIARGAAGKPTTRGGLKGKITYMSPEQCRADLAIDRRSDIYAVGTVLYELTTGRTPFSGETEYAVLNQIVNSDVPPPTGFVPDYPPALEKILLRALAREPAHRYTTAVELQGALEDFAHEMRLRVSPLVLARLMGTLFPARLEEWHHAKTQGAFFVEQHVVRTLIESGKTPDPNDPEVRAQLHELREQLDNEDPTAVNQPLEGADSTATTTVEPLSGRLMMPPGMDELPTTHRVLAASVDPPKRPSAPALPPPPAVPRTTPMPGMVPILSYGVPTPGTMVSHPGASPAYTPVDAVHTPLDARHAPSHAVDIGALADGIVAMPVSQFDVTERVQTRRHVTPTNFVRAAPRRKGPIIVLALCAAAAGGIATFIAFGGSSTAVVPPPPPPAPVAEPAHLVAPPPPIAAPDPTPAPVPVKAEPPPVIAEPPPKPVVKRPAIVRKPPPARPRPRATPKPKQEKPGWDADSPFLPVRTDKR